MDFVVQSILLRFKKLESTLNRKKVFSVKLFGLSWVVSVKVTGFLKCHFSVLLGGQVKIYSPPLQYIRVGAEVSELDISTPCHSKPERSAGPNTNCEKVCLLSHNFGQSVVQVLALCLRGGARSPLVFAR